MKKSPQGRSLEGASESDSVPQAKAVQNQGMEAKTEQESVSVAAPLGDHQRNASKDSGGSKTVQ